MSLGGQYRQHILYTIADTGWLYNAGYNFPQSCICQAKAQRESLLTRMIKQQFCGFL